MAWIARVIAPDLPHHVTQRGNRREPAFFIAMLERRLGRPFASRKPGPKPRVERDTAWQAQLL